MKVADYRDLISNLADVFASYRSAATKQESRAEVDRLRRAVKELIDVKCPTVRDGDRAERLMSQVIDVLSEYDQLF